MITISKNYTYIWELKNYPNYKITKCNLMINSKTGRVIKKCYNSGVIGYNIEGKFKSLKKLRTELTKIKKQIIPF